MFVQVKSFQFHPWCLYCFVMASVGSGWRHEVRNDKEKKNCKKFELMFLTVGTMIS
jgi:hypothetical protein